MLVPADTKYATLREEVTLLFQDVQLELVRCSLCGDYHPPELHLQAITPFDPFDPEED